MIGDVGETAAASAVILIAQEPMIADAADEDARITAVVIVADRHPHAIEADLVEAGLLGGVLEHAVAEIAIQLHGRRPAALLRSGPVARVDEENTLVAAAIVIKKRHSA